MLKIDENNNIYLTRADSCVLDLSVVDDEGNEYDYSNDLVQLTIKGSTLTDSVIIQKAITGDHFIIDPNDTKNLDYGVYRYDVQIINNSNAVYTVIGPANFVLCDEVNFNVTR